MKRALGTLAMNWLRKPENQERIKSTARDVWSRFQQRRDARAADRVDAADRPPSSARDSRNTAPRNRSDEQP